MFLIDFFEIVLQGKVILANLKAQIVKSEGKQPFSNFAPKS
jgi:hypothetical protein